MLAEAQTEICSNRFIDVKGLRFLDKIVHVSFDVDDLGLVWIYQFGWLRHRGESNVFQTDFAFKEPRVFGVPAAMQRQPFSIFRIGLDRFYLLAEASVNPRHPKGFALDFEGKVVAAFHSALFLLDAAVDNKGRLWIVGYPSLENSHEGLILECYSREGILEDTWDLLHWPRGQFSCLASFDGSLWIGGVSSEGYSKIEIWNPIRGQQLLEGLGYGPILGVGRTSGMELFHFDAEGQLFVHSREASEKIRLLQPDGQELHGSHAIRCLYKRIFLLSSRKEKIWEFRV